MYKIGLLGASNIAPTAMISPAQKNPDAQISAVAARVAKRAHAYAKQHDIPHSFDSYDALIASSEVDIVYVGLPPSHHAQWTIKSLEAGKHVICEKPIGMNVNEAQAMVTAAAASPGRLVEAFHTAYHSGFQTCQTWVQQGKIGSVVSLQSHFGVPLEDDGVRHQFRPETGGGSVMDMGCYPLNWVNAFAGASVESIEARANMTKSGVDGSMDAQLTFENGVIADISCSMIGPGGFSAGLTINGTDGIIDFSNPLVPHDNGTLSLTRNSVVVESLALSKVSTYEFQLESILSAFTSGAALPTEGDAIIHQQRLIDEVYKAAALERLRQPLQHQPFD